MSDLIRRQDAIDAVGNMLRRKFGIGEDLASITLAGLPSAQTEIVRCKDCKHWVVDSVFKTGWCNNKRRVMETSNNWFCADGERRRSE